jgi:hypothetical protein
VVIDCVVYLVPATRIAIANPTLLISEQNRSKRGTISMVALSIKEEARRIIDALPENSSWSDLMYEIYVHCEIEAGVRDLDQGRIQSHEEVKQRFGRPQ